MSQNPGPRAALCLLAVGLVVTALCASSFPVYFWRGHTRIKYKEAAESCPRHAVRCDGVADCKLKSDELGCGEQAGCACVHVSVNV